MRQYHGRDGGAARPACFGSGRYDQDRDRRRGASRRLPGRSRLAPVGYENEVNERGERLIWLDRAGGPAALAAWPRREL
jgi:hypothetical protein